MKLPALFKWNLTTASHGFLILTCLALTGCARSTIESRKQERYGSYSSLKPEFQSMVDNGQIEIGMPLDAVYIAWGKPTQKVTSQGPAGNILTWIYMGTRLESYHYWAHGPPYYHGRRGYGYSSAPYLAHGYYPKEYLSAEVVFEEQQVKSWRRLDYTY